MGKYSAPEIGRSSPIYRMAKNRNYKVLFTSLAIFIFGILTLYDGIVRPEPRPRRPSCLISSSSASPCMASTLS